MDKLDTDGYTHLREFSTKTDSPQFGKIKLQRPKSGLRSLASKTEGPVRFKQAAVLSPDEMRAKILAKRGTRPPVATPAPVGAPAPVATPGPVATPTPVTTKTPLYNPGPVGAGGPVASKTPLYDPKAPESAGNPWMTYGPLALIAGNLALLAYMSRRKKKEQEKRSYAVPHVGDVIDRLRAGQPIAEVLSHIEKQAMTDEGYAQWKPVVDRISAPQGTPAAAATPAAVAGYPALYKVAGFPFFGKKTPKPATPAAPPAAMPAAPPQRIIVPGDAQPPMVPPRIEIPGETPVPLAGKKIETPDWESQPKREPTPGEPWPAELTPQGRKPADWPTGETSAGKPPGGAPDAAAGAAPKSLWARTWKPTAAVAGAVAGPTVGALLGKTIFDMQRYAGRGMSGGAEYDLHYPWLRWAGTPKPEAAPTSFTPEGQELARWRGLVEPYAQVPEELLGVMPTEYRQLRRDWAGRYGKEILPKVQTKYVPSAQYKPSNDPWLNTYQPRLEALAKTIPNSVADADLNMYRDPERVANLMEALADQFNTSNPEAYDKWDAANRAAFAKQPAPSDWYTSGAGDFAQYLPEYLHAMRSVPANADATKALRALAASRQNEFEQPIPPDMDIGNLLYNLLAGRVGPREQ